MRHFDLISTLIGPGAGERSVSLLCSRDCGLLPFCDGDLSVLGLGDKRIEVDQDEQALADLAYPRTYSRSICPKFWGWFEVGLRNAENIRNLIHYDQAFSKAR